MPISFFIGIILIIIGIIIIIDSIYSLRHIHQINQDIDEKNRELESINQELLKKTESINAFIQLKTHDINDLQNIIEKKEKQLSDIQNNISKTLDNQKELSQKAFESYCETLENKYKETEEEYEQYTDAMQTAYSNLQLKLLREADDCREELEKIRATRAAAIEAQRKEEEIKRNISSYCIIPSKNDLEDIKKLEKIKIVLHNPVILSKLIWSTYYQKEMTKFCNNMLGTDAVCGIYKITNQINNKCYIGQSVNIASRFKDHMKGGLGVNGSTGNKLYKAMREDGVWNFSWEVLEKCSREQLNEKERFYIDFYQSKEFGYNTLKGIG